MKVTQAKHTPGQPSISIDAAARFVREHYGIEGELTPLPSYDDQNFRVDATDGAFTLKISNAAAPRELVEAENTVMLTLSAPRFEVEVPRPLATLGGDMVTDVVAPDTGMTHLTRLLTFVRGEVFATSSRTGEILTSLGHCMGEVSRGLSSLEIPATRRSYDWDLMRALDVCGARIEHISDSNRRGLVESWLDDAKAHVLPFFAGLRRSLIHADANDYNVIVREVDGKRHTVGIVDFGDIMESCTVFDLAVCCTYAMMDCDDTMEAARILTHAYLERFDLFDNEVNLLFRLAVLRLCTSVCMSAARRATGSPDEYSTVSEESAWKLLTALTEIGAAAGTRMFREAVGLPDRKHATNEQLLAERSAFLGPSLSLSYDDPLHIVRGAGQYLYDSDGRAYLDAVNNVPHVGHCHPRVVVAGQRQMELLNTNTRYLHESVIRYARRLTDAVPDGLDVCFFVNSGSEANDLALRMAQAHTGRAGAMVLDGAYHGNLSSLIGISPYKFHGPGGRGPGAGVTTVPMPDPFRGAHRGYSQKAAAAYASEIRRMLDDDPAVANYLSAFIAESLPGCGGQIVFPHGYLSMVYDVVRAHGGICIADEVQVGFGRVGTHFWGFQTQDVVPDIVTLGKPIANGHPMGAVITTREIARSFDTGMEYFNTFGGNPVSAEIALAVLDVIEDENLQERALEVGKYLMGLLKTLKHEHPLIGDVRGAGLFIGVELVRDPETLEPAVSEATGIVEEMKNRGILISVDGPLHNVLKIKPPLVFSKTDATRLANTLDEVLIDLEA